MTLFPCRSSTIYRPPEPPRTRQGLRASPSFKSGAKSLAFRVCLALSFIQPLHAYSELAKLMITASCEKCSARRILASAPGDANRAAAHRRAKADSGAHARWYSE